MVKKSKKSEPDVSFQSGKAYGRTQQLAANALGADRGTYLKWLSQSGINGMAGKWPITDVVSWLREKKSLEPEGDDELMFGHSSPALEKYRQVVTELKELDLAKRRGELVERDAVQEGLARIAVVMRSLNEQTKLRFPEVQELLNQCLEDLDREFDNFFITP
jgi:hypothetical protein